MLAGYINIDETNLYFTTSRNWAETKKLSEKRTGKSMRGAFKNMSVYLFTGLLVAIFISFLVAKFSSGELTIFWSSKLLLAFLLYANTLSLTLVSGFTFP